MVLPEAERECRLAGQTGSPTMRQSWRMCWTHPPSTNLGFHWHRPSWLAEWSVMNLLPDGAEGYTGTLFFSPLSEDNTYGIVYQQVAVRPDGDFWTVEPLGDLDRAAATSNRGGNVPLSQFGHSALHHLCGRDCNSSRGGRCPTPAQRATTPYSSTSHSDGCWAGGWAFHLSAALTRSQPRSCPHASVHHNAAMRLGLRVQPERHRRVFRATLMVDPRHPHAPTPPPRRLAPASGQPHTHRLRRLSPASAI